MANLRIVQFFVTGPRTIKTSFTEALSPSISTSNVSITSLTTSVADPEVISVSVSDRILTIATSPLVPEAIYTITYARTDTVPFASFNGQSHVLEDGRTNVKQFQGPEEANSPVRDNILSLLSNNIYNLSRGTLIRTVINQISQNIQKSYYDIRQLKNDNYLKIKVIDEQKKRGKGPYDRLSEEGAFHIIRVGKNATDASLDGLIAYSAFPSDVITLQQTDASEELTIGVAQAGTFNGLLLTLSHEPITKVNSITISYTDASDYVYDLSSYGYQIRESKYDTARASTYLLLEDNQIQLSLEITEDPDFPRIPTTGDTITIEYEYKHTGKIIDEDSVKVYATSQAVREAVPALLNKFNLDHAPVVSSTGSTPSSGGIQFLDPESETPFLTTHPAFVREIPFGGKLPSVIGEYSVDYEAGTVYVYGATSDKEGTGYYPPAATYYYKFFYRKDLDYTYYPDAFELAASPVRDLIDDEADVEFSYEHVLIPGTDYKAQVHAEALNERIENRLIALNAIRALNSPVTNAFRIFNETSGEIYSVSRINTDKIYFNYNTPPRILDKARERANFTIVTNETLIVQQELENVSLIKIFKIQLLNQNVMGATDDVIGSSFNTSVIFSKTNVFDTERYFDGQILSVDDNLDKLSIGEYLVDYVGGYIYVAVSSDQNYDIGSVTYKKPVISPANPHVIAVSDIYYSIDPNFPPKQHLNYSSFDDGEITPTTLALSDERFTDGDETQQYQLIAGEIEVTSDIKTVRHLYDVDDLNDNAEPTDFSSLCTFAGNVITVTGGIEKFEVLTLGGSLDITIATISAGIQLLDAVSVIRASDGVQLLNGSETIAGNTITLNLGSPGDEVNVFYTVELTSASTPVVDYDKGGYYFDYTYLFDEILISYEYGDNVLDFSESDALNEGETYFATYEYGALRDALQANFASLVDIPEVRVFDIELPRESYRDLLTGAMQSFLKGPTIPAMEQLVSNVSKITPEIIEAIFEVWSLGNSYLHRDEIQVNGSPQIVVGKFDGGIAITDADQYVTFPASSNLRLEEGTLEMWVVPEWNGLDNDATLTVSNLKKDGEYISAASIYIGASSFNPEMDDYSFVLNRTDDQSPIGLPAAVFTEAGVFIYYDEDEGRWKLLVKDAAEGHDGYSYTGSVYTSGEMYDVKFIEGINEIDDILRSFTDHIEFNLHINPADGYDGYLDGYDGYMAADGYIAGYSFDGITFMSDQNHYLFDFAETATKNRFSLYKDGSGYLNFTVWDAGSRFPQKPGAKNRFVISADIQDWASGEKHHIAASWKLNTKDRRDEMHLFIDGFEAYNILKYGGRPTASSSNRFRTVAPELVAGTIPSVIIVGEDLATTSGSTTVTGSVNFGALGVLAGDSIEIQEDGFGTYTISSVSGSTLVLSTTMPATLSDARFSINPYSVIVSSAIDLSANIMVSLLRAGEEIELPGLRADSPGYEISKNMLNQNILTILGDADVGDEVLIRTLGLNHRRCRTKVYLWGDKAVLKTHLPPPVNLDEVSVKPLLLPLTPIGPANSTISLGQFIANITGVTNTSNVTEGRRLDVRITGGNVQFSSSTTVTLNGTTFSGATSELLTFTAVGTQSTTEYWKTITSVDVVTTPLSISYNGTAVEIKEKYSILYSDGNNTYPVVRFAFQTQSGNSLESDGSDVVSDSSGFFPASDVGNILVIGSGPAAGTYTITERINNTSVRLDSVTGTAFTGAIYNIYNISIGRSGFQNGFFFFQEAGTSNIAYELPAGYYEFDYAAYLEIPFAPVKQMAYIGSDFNGNNQAKAVIDEFRILNEMLTDTRVGETLADNETSITTDNNSIRPFRKNEQTLMLLHFDELPLENDSDYYKFAENSYIQSGGSVGENFGKSIVFLTNGLTFENKGVLNTQDQGTIEFWVSPRYDTYNDPVNRVYFDATSTVVEEVLSLTTGSVKVGGRIDTILSVTLLTSEEDYFAGGSIASDRQTIRLKKALPNQQVMVKVAYIPSGLSGDRMTIYKDYAGFIAFNVRAGGVDYQVRTPVLWPRDTWHRVRATFKLNQVDNLDEIRLFVDGEERGVVMFGSGLLFGDGTVFGQTTVGVTNQILITNIDFTDPINQYNIGMNYLGVSGAQARIDNLRISNLSRPPLSIAGQPFDVNYGTNVDVIFPVIEDAYTTFLMNFENLVEKTDDFAVLRDEAFGIFNFTINIIDSFGIVSGNDRVRTVLEAMIEALKPATAKVDINVIS